MTATLERDIGEIRAFNRFYTRLLGGLNEGLLKSRFSLAESRVLYELGSRGSCTASDLAADLGLDQAYLSRILKKFRDEGLLAAERSATDGRAQTLTLTRDGTDAFTALDRASHDEIAAQLKPLGDEATRELVRSMRRIRRLLEPAAAAALPWIIRPHRIGDIGWIVRRHGMLYAQEYGWDGSFEGLVAEIAGAFLTRHDPARERCWVAERDGDILGSVFLVDAGENVAKLRLLYVEPAARGAGVGRRLVEECIAFARLAGYARMTLWTNDILVSARHIYQAQGFVLVSEEKHRSFGKDLVGQYWSLDL